MMFRFQGQAKLQRLVAELIGNLSRIKRYLLMIWHWVVHPLSLMRWPHTLRGLSNQSDTDENEDLTDVIAVDVQTRILPELKKMNARWDMVEYQVTGATGTRKHIKQDSK